MGSSTCEGEVEVRSDTLIRNTEGSDKSEDVPLHAMKADRGNRGLAPCILNISVGLG
jgi:hypothetical protein